MRIELCPIVGRRCYCRSDGRDKSIDVSSIDESPEKISLHDLQEVDICQSSSIKAQQARSRVGERLLDS